MMTLLDANVLVYAVNADAPQQSASRAVLQAAMLGRLLGVLVPQVLLEFFAVITNARRVQHPLPPEVAWSQVTLLRTSLPVLPIAPASLDVLDALVRDQRPTGAKVFDLFLVAQMRAHLVNTICTYNTADFAAVPGIAAVTPELLLASLP